MDLSRRSPQPQFIIPNQMKNNETKDNKYTSLKGFFLAGLAAVSYSIDAVAVKSIKNVHPIQLTLYRFLAILVLCIPEVLKCREHPLGTKDVRIFLVLRGVFGGISIFFAYTSYHLLPLGETFIIISSMPMFVTLTAFIFLKEPCGIFQSILVILTVTGIIFTTKVPSRLMGNNVEYTTESIYGILAAIGALSCRTFMMLCVRKAKKVHYSVMLFNFGWVSVVECLALMPILTNFNLHRCGIQWFYILLMGISSYAGQVALTLALKCEFAGPVSTIMSAGNIVVAFLWQIFLFGDIPDIFTVCGAAIVGFCIMLASIRRWASSLPKNSTHRERLKWVLV